MITEEEIAEYMTRKVLDLDILKCGFLTRDIASDNIVSTGNLKCNNLDLEAIASKNPTVRYQPTCLDALLMKFPDRPGVVGLVSASGRVVCGGDGFSTKHDSIIFAQLVASELSRMVGHPLEYIDGIKVEVEYASVDASGKELLNGHAISTKSETYVKRVARRCGAFCFLWIDKAIKILLRYLGFAELKAED